MFFIFNIKDKVVDKIKPVDEEKEIITNITQSKPSYLSYEDLIKQAELWRSESNGLVYVENYGLSSKGKNLTFVRVFNQNTDAYKPVVLVTACIHGNEPLSTATIMWYIGSLLKEYNQNPLVKDIVDNRDIYFIPVVSPDSYPNSRHVDGVDPNRNFSALNDSVSKSVRPVSALQRLFQEIKPKAVLSGHTYGRVFLFPHGDTMEKCKDHDAFLHITNEMSKRSGYKNIRACELYGSTGKNTDVPVRIYGDTVSPYKVNVPIYGTEVDWYYRNGSFAIVMEFGTHQRKPTDKEIEYEYQRTWDAFLYFLKESPLVEINPETKTILSNYDNIYGDFGDE